MTDREALKQALEQALDFIERLNRNGWVLADFEPQMYATLAALREALAQPAQQPLTNEQIDNDAVLAEREACAKMIESHGPHQPYGAMLAAAIRARSEA